VVLVYGLITSKVEGPVSSMPLIQEGTVICGGASPLVVFDAASVLLCDMASVLFSRECKCLRLNWYLLLLPLWPWFALVSQVLCFGFEVASSPSDTKVPPRSTFKTIGLAKL
jgi:hypothetical protein